MLARHDETLPELKDETPAATPPQPPEPPIEEREYPPRKGSGNLVCKITRVSIDGCEFKQIAVTAKKGRVIEEFRRYTPIDDDDTARLTGRSCRDRFSPEVLSDSLADLARDRNNKPINRGSFPYPSAQGRAASERPGEGISPRDNLILIPQASSSSQNGVHYI